jgi:16S rRNA (guanine966-N2)-methyltransferase
MTRIIGGVAGSLRLLTPSSATRPTSDRVREALFSSLEAKDVVAGARVLDGFAGSGALGLEAASRGATHVTFVENAAGAHTVIRANISALKSSLTHQPELTVVPKTMAAFLTAHKGDAFDLVFLDPPYELDTPSIESLVVTLLPHVMQGGRVVLERSTRSAPVLWPEGFQEDESKKYGETVLYFATKV